MAKGKAYITFGVDIEEFNPVDEHGSYDDLILDGKVQKVTTSDGRDVVNVEIHSKDPDELLKNIAEAENDAGTMIVIGTNIGSNAIWNAAKLDRGSLISTGVAVVGEAVMPTYNSGINDTDLHDAKFIITAGRIASVQVTNIEKKLVKLDNDILPSHSDFIYKKGDNLLMLNISSSGTSYTFNSFKEVERSNNPVDVLTSREIDTGTVLVPPVTVVDGSDSYGIDHNVTANVNIHSFGTGRERQNHDVVDYVEQPADATKYRLYPVSAPIEIFHKSGDTVTKTIYKTLHYPLADAQRSNYHDFMPYWMPGMIRFRDSDASSGVSYSQIDEANDMIFCILVKEDKPYLIPLDSNNISRSLLPTDGDGYTIYTQIVPDLFQISGKVAIEAKGSVFSLEDMKYSTNRQRAFDQFSNSYAKFGAFDKIQFKPVNKCPFDFVGFRGLTSTGMIVKIYDIAKYNSATTEEEISAAVVESHNIKADFSAYPMSFEEMLDCTTCQPDSFTACDYSIGKGTAGLNLNSIYDGDKYFIEVETTIGMTIGAFFVGKNVEIECLSASSTPSFDGFSYFTENKRMGTVEMDPNENARLQTQVDVTFERPSAAAGFFQHVLNNAQSILFYNLYENEEYSAYSHSGVPKNIRTDRGGRTVSFKLQEVNNA